MVVKLMKALLCYYLILDTLSVQGEAFNQVNTVDEFVFIHIQDVCYDL